MSDVILIGYSGHAYVVAEILRLMNRRIIGYCDVEEKPDNVVGIPYLGYELRDEALKHLREADYFVAIGDNGRRDRVIRSLKERGLSDPITIIHPHSAVASTAHVGRGVMVGPSATINPFVTISDGVVCNSGCVVEHECALGEYSHIAPGAVLAGNVHVGSRTFVGANAVVKDGVSIGADCVVGAGAVIIRNIPDGTKVVGNPGRILE